MDSNLKPLIRLSPLDIKPQSLYAFEDGFKFLNQLTAGMGEVEFTSSIQSHITKVPAEEKRIQLGLLYTALTEDNIQKQMVFNMLMISRDGLGFVLHEMQRLCIELWPKMEQKVRSNTIRLVAELINSDVSAVEHLVAHLLKRMSCGDLRHANFWLCGAMVDLLTSKRDWLEHTSRTPHLLPTAVFSFLRILPDHFMPDVNADVQRILADIKAKEVAFLVTTISRQFDRLLIMGRDFIRLLHDAAEIPEFGPIWRNILHNPSVLSPRFTGIMQLLETPTPQALIATFIPHEMEEWIRFMLKNVNFTANAPYKRYQEMFQRKFFTTPESQSLRVCLIRYIVTVFFPDNNMLASSLIPRWVVISWLISQCTSYVAISNAKLALVYDWLFYTENDCIMVIEPAILAIMNNLQRSPATSISIVDFLIKVTHQYYPPISGDIIHGIRFGLQDMLSKTVIRGLAPLFDVIRSDADLTRNTRDLFGDAVSPSVAPVGVPTPSLPPTSTPVQSARISAPIPSGGHSNSSTGSNNYSSNTTSRGPPPNRQHAPPTSLGNNHTANNHSNSFHTGNTLVDDGRVPFPSVSPLVNAPPLLSSEDRFTPSSPLLDPRTHSDGLYPVLGDNHVSLGNHDLPNKRRRSSSRSSGLPPAKFSDDEDEDVSDDEFITGELKLDEMRRRFNDYRLRYQYNVLRVSPGPILDTIGQPIKKALERVQNALSRGTEEDTEHDEDPCDAVEGLVSAVLEDDNFDDLEIAGRTATVLCQLCYAQFDRPIFPLDVTDENLEESISAPIFVLFRNVCQMSATDTKRELLLLLLSEMYSKQPRLGYYLLYFLKVGKINDERYMAYRNFCASQDQPNLSHSLYKDMQLVSLDDRRLFVFLLPDVYTVFEEEVLGDPKFVHLVCQSVDSAQMSDIVGEVMQSHLKMFVKESLTKVLVQSLEWETTEQYFLWQLLNAHELPTDNFLPFLHHLHYKKHPEAMSNLMIMFKLEKPTEELMRAVLSRDVSCQDMFSVSILHFWGNQHTSRLAIILHSLVTAPGKDKKKIKKESGGGPSPILHPTSQNQGPSLGQILGHLDAIRNKCRNIEFLQHEQIQSSLQWVQIHGSEEVKMRFSELLALAEDPDQDGSGSGPQLSESGLGREGGKPGGRVLRNLVSRKAAQAERRQTSGETRTSMGKRSHSSSESDSDTEEDLNLKAKKRKKSALSLEDDE